MRRWLRRLVSPNWDQKITHAERVRNDHFERRFYAGRFI